MLLIFLRCLNLLHGFRCHNVHLCGLFSFHAASLICARIIVQMLLFIASPFWSAFIGLHFTVYGASGVEQTIVFFFVLKST
jgi:hypothetical protein